jgi:transposase
MFTPPMFTPPMLAEADLPEDIEALRTFALEQSRKLAEVTLAKGEADAELERLQSIIDAFMRHRFGRRSDQLDPDQLELGLEDIETALGQARASRDAATGQERGARARNANRGSLPERLDVVPTTFRVLVTRRPRYGCRSCEGTVVQAAAPARIVEGGIPTEALIAQVLVAKYADHLPLYRQAQIYARQGIKLDRSTLADWVGRAAWYLRPLRDHTLEELRKAERLFADETTAPVLDPGRRRTKTGQLWAYESCGYHR